MFFSLSIFLIFLEIVLLGKIIFWVALQGNDSNPAFAACEEGKEKMYGAQRNGTRYRNVCLSTAFLIDRRWDSLAAQLPRFPINGIRKEKEPFILLFPSQRAKQGYRERLLSQQLGGPE